MRNIIERKFLEIQDMILDGLLSFESKKNRKPIVDNWKSKIGKGKTCVIENGSVFEKAVVTFSSVSGKNLPASSGMSANISGETEIKNKDDIVNFFNYEDVALFDESLGNLKKPTKIFDLKLKKYIR